MDIVSGYQVILVSASLFLLIAVPIVVTGIKQKRQIK